MTAHQANAFASKTTSDWPVTVALRDTSTFRNASLADATLPAQWDNQSPATMRDNVLANLLLRCVFLS